MPNSQEELQLKKLIDIIKNIDWDSEKNKVPESVKTESDFIDWVKEVGNEL